MLSTGILKKQQCPTCNRNGLHYPDHAHAKGRKNFKAIRCRFCKAQFSIIKAENFYMGDAVIMPEPDKAEIDTYKEPFIGQITGTNFRYDWNGINVHNHQTSANHPIDGRRVLKLLVRSER